MPGNLGQCVGRCVCCGSYLAVHWYEVDGDLFCVACGGPESDPPLPIPSPDLNLECEGCDNCSLKSK